MRKYENVDIIAALGAVLEINTEYYKGDFKYDIEMFWEAAERPDGENDHLLWLSRHSGTHCSPERDAYFIESYAYLTWLYHAESKGEGLRAYAVEITGLVNGRIMGNLYELDYRRHASELKEAALPCAMVKLIFKDGMEKRMTYKEYDSQRERLYYQYGKTVYLRREPENEDELRAVLQAARDKREKDARPAPFKVRIQNRGKYLCGNGETMGDAQVFELWSKFYPDNCNVKERALLIAPAKIKEKVILDEFTVVFPTVKITPEEIQRLNSLLEYQLSCYTEADVYELIRWIEATGVLGNNQKVSEFEYINWSEAIDCTGSMLAYSSDKGAHGFFWDLSDPEESDKMLAYDYWDGHNWQTIYSDDFQVKTKIQISAINISLDVWDDCILNAHGLGGHAHIHHVYTIDGRPVNDRYLVRCSSQWPGREEGTLMNSDELIEYVKSLTNRDTDDLMTKLDSLIW